MSNSEKNVPKSLNECYETDYVSGNLWDWCDRLETWGKVLFVLFLVFGLILAIFMSITSSEETTSYYAEAETHFDFIVFFTALLQTILYAFIEYFTYHFLSLLIASLATIVQNTKITANVALYTVAKEEGALNDNHSNNTPSTYSPPKSSMHKINFDGSWICNNCGRKNDANNLYCKDCGKYK